jgi:hypothetical protein
LLRNGLHNPVVLPLLGADDIEDTASWIVAGWTVFTELFPGNALIKSVTILRRYVPAKSRLIFNGVHDVMFQKIEITNVIILSDLTPHSPAEICLSFRGCYCSLYIQVGNVNQAKSKQKERISAWSPKGVNFNISDKMRQIYVNLQQKWCCLQVERLQTLLPFPFSGHLVNYSVWIEHTVAHKLMWKLTYSIHAVIKYFKIQMFHFPLVFSVHLSYPFCLSNFFLLSQLYKIWQDFTAYTH